MWMPSSTAFLEEIKADLCGKCTKLGARRSLMKLIFVTSVLAISLVGCKHGIEMKQPVTISYDRWWSSDYAAEAAWGTCSASKLGLSTERCIDKDEARADEAEFLERFSAAFRSDQACSGLRLIIYGGPDNTSKNSYKELSRVEDEGYWDLIVDYRPEREKQSWRLSLVKKTHTTENGSASGEGNAQTVSHAVCSIVKQPGGSVVE
jgi:hypothetical protein